MCLQKLINFLQDKLNKSTHLEFSELLALAQAKDKEEDKIAHLKACERCLSDYAIAVALVSRLKERSEPVEVVLGRITSHMMRKPPELDDLNRASWEVVGSDALSALVLIDRNGLMLRLTSECYEVGHLKVTIYKKTKRAKRWTEYKSGTTSKDGYLYFGRIPKEDESHRYQYLVSVQGILRPKQEKQTADSVISNISSQEKR